MVQKILVSSSLACILSGCSGILLPNFDGGLLNPEVRFLQAGEVINSAKCATIQFIREREKQLLIQRMDIANRDFLTAREGPELESHFNPYVINARTIISEKLKQPSNHLNKLLLQLKAIKNDNSVTQDNKRIASDKIGNEAKFFEKEISIIKQIGYCRPLNSLAETTPRNSYYDISPGDNKKIDALNPVYFRHAEWIDGDYKSTKHGRWKCVSNVCKPTLGLTLWDYNKTSSDPTKVSTEIAKDACASVPDYSRFALDATQSATIELQLTGSTQGNINYTQIDVSRMGALQNIIAEGIRPPFSINNTAKGTLIFQLSALLPQSLISQPMYNYDEESLRLAALRELDALQAELKRVGGAATEITQKKVEALKSNLEMGEYAEAKEGAESIQKEIESSDVKNNSRLITQLKRVRELIAKTGEVTLAAKDKDVGSFRRDLAPTAQPIMPPSTPSPAQGISAARGDSRIQDETRAWQARENIKLKKLMREDFAYGCSSEDTLKIDNSTEIDYLGLKKLLHNVVFEQDKDVYHSSKGGVPEISLDKLTLTTSFQLVLDASAGTKHIFRIFPLLIPPTMGIKPDHTHQLKITFQGVGKKGDPDSAKRAKQGCLQRIQSNAAETSGGGQTPEDFCKSGQGILLQGILEALEKSGGGGTTATKNAGE